MECLEYFTELWKEREQEPHEGDRSTSCHDALANSDATATSHPSA